MVWFGACIIYTVVCICGGVVGFYDMIDGHLICLTRKDKGDGMHHQINRRMNVSDFIKVGKTHAVVR